MADKRLSPFTFAVKAEFAAVDAAVPGSRKFSGIAYGGGLITDHPYLGPLVIDIASTKFQTPSPALYDHETPIGVISSANLDKQISIEGKLFAGVNAKAKEVSDMADAGMPWQMSVGVFPGSIDEIPRGRTVIVNSHKFSGPVTIFRDNRIRETSFCALGAATDTNAQVFSVGGDGSPPQFSGVEMDQAEHDRIVADLNAKLTGANELATKQAADLTKVNADLATLTASIKIRETAERTEAVKALFKAIALEYKDELAKPYIDMTAEQFGAVSAQMQKKPAAADPALYATQATNGKAGVINMADANAIATAARRYIAEQKKDGVHVEVHEAVTFVAQSNQQAAA